MTTNVNANPTSITSQLLRNKRAVVIGAGSIGAGWGIGRATVATFLDGGAEVFGVDRDEAALDETVKVAGEMHLGICDVTNFADITRVIEEATQKMGGIDILINSVGGSEIGDVVSLERAAWDRQISINLSYVFDTMKCVIPHMLEQGGGSIVNVSSVAGLRSMGTDFVGYAASKAALIQLSRSTAVKYADQNIRVTTVVPGLMDTPLVTERLLKQPGAADRDTLIANRNARVPMNRMGDGWDVANAIAFLASDSARYITATELVVDGGFTASSVSPARALANL